MKRTITTLCALALLAGCARPISRPDRALSVPAPKTWSGLEVEDPSRSAEPDPAWWASFQDRGLEQAIAHALEHNKSLTAAAARIDAARAQARIAGAAELPELNASLTRTRQRMNFIGLPIPGRQGVLSSRATNIGPSLNLSWEADIWGRVKAGKLAAGSEMQAAEADLAGVRLSLSGQTAKAWLAAVESRRQLELAEDSLASYRRSADRVRARFEAGVRPSLDLRLALTEVSRAESAVEQRRLQLDASVRQLELLLGQYPSGDYGLAQELPPMPAPPPAGLPSDLLHRRPDLVAAERRLLGADARIAQAKTSLRPRFNLTASGGTATNRLQQILDGDVLVWSLIGGLTQPIFNNGRLKATVDQNEAAAREAFAMYENALLQAYGEVESSMAAEKLLDEQQSALTEAVSQATAAQNLAEERYRAGLADIITVLQAQRATIDSESALLSIRRAALDNRIDLHLALGGGFAYAGGPDAD